MRSLLTSLLLATALATPAVAQTVPTRTIGTATLQDVPEIPAEVSAGVQKYESVRSALFEDWLADGSMLIATRFGATQQIHHVAAPGAARSQLTFYDEPVNFAKAIPGTDRFLLVRDTGGDEWFQIYAKPLAGPAVLLTEAGTRNQAPVLSKDGRMIAWARATKGSQAYTILTANPADPASRREIHQVDGAVEVADISADGSTLLFVRGLSNRESQLFSLDLKSGAVTRIAADANPARYDDAHFTGDGRGILTLSDRAGDMRHLFEIDVATGKAIDLTPDLKWDVEAYELSTDGRTLAYAVNEDGFSRVVIQDRILRRALPAPKLPRGVLTGMGFSPDGKRLAVGVSAATTAGDVWAVDVASGDATRWTRSELGNADAAQMAEPELIRFKSFDGLSIPALVYRPKAVAPGARTPVMIDIHGGPEAQTRPSFNPGAQYFADSLGATVILPNVRGSDGYGKRYLNLDNAEKREDSVKDIGALLDWVAKDARLDSKRVAVYGQSYGGYMSLAVMTHYADRLVGGVERYGISNWVSFLERTEAYRRDNRRAEYGDERDPKMRAVFDRISPLASVAKITKPMLVMQGANDPRVPQYESEQVVAAIRKNNVPAWYVLFADEGHGFQKKPNNELRRAVETVFLRGLFEGGE